MSQVPQAPGGIFVPQPTLEPPGSGTDPFSSPEPAPDGIPGGLFKSSPDVSCPGSLGPGEQADPFSVEAGHVHLVCFSGFDPAQTTIELSVARPDGTTSTASVSNDSGSAIWLVQPVPGDLKGDFSFSASQANIAPATGDFSVVTATTPAVVSLVGSGPPGTTFQIGLAGFTGSVPVYLYSTSPGDSMWNFFAALPQTEVDEEGEAIIDVPSSSSDAPGLYGVTTDPPAVCFSSPPCATLEITG